MSPDHRRVRSPIRLRIQPACALLLGSSVLFQACGDPNEQGNATLVLSATAHDFGDLSIGTHSPVLTLTVSNPGPDDVPALSVALAGPAAQDFELLKDTCSGTSLDAGQSCELQIELVPATLGTRQVVLTVSAPGVEAVSATLSGNGATTGLLLSPTVVTFAEAAVGQVGQLKTVTVRNNGSRESGAITVALSGTGAAEFQVTRDVCTSVSLQRNASCAIDIRFHPATTGSHVATLTVSSADAPARSAQLLAIAGEPTTLMAAPASHVFAPQVVGTFSDVIAFTVANAGLRPSGAITVQMAGPNTTDFHVTTTGCYPLLEIGASCAIEVRFVPQATGVRTASVNVTDPLGSSVSIPLSGEGQPTPPPPTPLQLSPAGFAFAPLLIGAMASQTVTVTNSGHVATGPLGTSLSVCEYYYGCSPSTYFLLEDDQCAGISLPAGGSCTVKITFQPLYIGFVTAEFEVGAPGFIGSLIVSGSGVGLHASTQNLNFAPTPVGSTSASETIIITNSGTGPTGPIATEVSGFFFEISSNTCAGAILQPGGFCTIAARFKPTVPGARLGTVGVIATPGGTVFIQLSGTGL